MREATDKGNADVLLEFRSVLQSRAWTQIFPRRYVSIFRAALERVFGLAVLLLDSLTEEQPVLTERVIWRVEEEDGSFVGILGVELLCDHQAD